MGRETLCSIAILSIAFLLLCDWPILFGIQNQFKSHKESKVQSDSYSEQFLLEQYHTAIKEIELRLDEEHLLFGMKFTLVGGILALFFGYAFRSRLHDREAFNGLRNSSMAACFFWAAVVTSSLVDCRILFNADFISTLGSWIKYNVEPTFYPSGKMGWEHFLSNSNLFDSPVYPLLRLNSSILTLLMFYVTLFLFAIGKELRNINLLGIIASLITFCLAALHYHYTSVLWALICALLLFLGILFSILLLRPS